MIDGETRAALAALLEHLKAQRVALSSLLADVGAIRHSLIEIGPEYRAVLERHRRKHIEEGRDLLCSDIEKLQEIIDKLNGG